MQTIKATHISRHADSVNANIRHIAVLPQGEEKAIVLGTPIEKIEKPDAFRQVGTKKVPVEQYEFRVGDKICSRFAEATALVIQAHGVELVGDATKQKYVQKALELVGTKQ